MNLYLCFMRRFFLIVCICTAPHLTEAQARELTLRFDINPVISGSRPWDGTGLNSAQLDSNEESKSWFGIGSSVLGQAGLDQLNQRMAPPDPYICLVLTNQPTLSCYRNLMEKDTLRLTVSIPAEMVDRAWFGVVLIDSDVGNVTGGADDLIGFGVVLDEPTLAAVRNGDSRARSVAAEAENIVTRAVENTFGAHRSLLGAAGGGRVDAAKLSVSKCESGCIMGDSMIFITTSLDGW